MNFFFNKVLIASFSTFFLFFSSAALPVNHTVPTFKAEYKLSHNNIEIGHVELTVKASTNDQYQLISSTQTSGLLAFLRDDDVTEISRFELTNEHIRPLSYQYKQDLGNKLKDIKLTFDWDTSTLTNSSEGINWTMNVSKGVLDKALMQVALMLDLKNAGDTLTYQIADGGKLKQYVFTRLGAEQITVAGKSYDTIKLARKKDEKPLITYYWCATALHNLPILLQREKSYGTFEMRLLKIKFD